LLISRRREAKRRALLQLLDRIPVRPTSKSATPRVRTLPVDAPLTAAAPSVPEGLQRVKQ
jgi:hypothetical protein